METTNEELLQTIVCEPQVYEQFYDQKYLHKFLAEDNCNIRMQAYIKACVHGGFELFGLNYEFGGHALLQISADGREQMLIEKYHNLKVDVLDDGMIAVRTSLRGEESSWQSSLVVGTQEAGFCVAAHNVSKEECYNILQSYKKEYVQ